LSKAGWPLLKILGVFSGMDNTVLFHAYFNHGYALRTLVQVFVQEKGMILMLLKPDCIEFHNTAVMRNGDNSVFQSIYQCTLKADEIMDYNYNIRGGANQELLPFFPVHLEVDKLHKRTKDLNKSAGIKLTWGSPNTDVIQLTIVNGAMLTDTPPVQLNLTQTAQVMTGDQYDSMPNVKVIFQEFRTWLDAVGKHCIEMRIVGKKSCVIISLLDSNRNIISSKTFGTPTVNKSVATGLPQIMGLPVLSNNGDHGMPNLSGVDISGGVSNGSTAPTFTFVDPDEIAAISIPKTLGMFTALMKLTADKHSILRFYFKEGQPIRIDISSGNFANLSLKVLNTPIAADQN